MGPLTLAAIELGTILLGEALKALRPKPRPVPLEFPTAEEDRIIPVVYGTGVVTPNILAWGDTSTKDVSTSKAFMTAYYARMVLGVCHGPVDELVDILYDGKSIRLLPVTRRSSGDDDVVDDDTKLSYTVSPSLPKTRPTDGSVTTFYTSGLNLFGGRFDASVAVSTSDDAGVAFTSPEGGVAGIVRAHWGVASQTADDLVVHLAGEDKAPGWPDLCYLTFGADPDGDWDAYQLSSGQYYWGIRPNPPAVRVVVRAFPTALLGSVADSRCGNNANFVEVIYDLLTHTRRGAGIDTTLIDTDAFTAAAETAQAKNMGVSMTLDSERDPFDIIDDICRTHDAVVFKDPETGLLNITIMQADYTVANLLNITPSNAPDFTLSVPGIDDTTNEVRVSYRRFDGAAAGTVTDEPLTGSYEKNGTYLITFSGAYYQLAGRNISSVVVHDVTQDVDLVTSPNTGTSVYVIDAAAGVIFVHDNGPDDGRPQVVAGDELTVSYVAGTSDVGYKDAVTAPEHDLANIATTGTVRSTTIPYPYLTNDVDAKQAAIRSLRKLSLPLQKARFTVNREGHALKPGDPFRVNQPRFGLVDAVFRISTAQWGPLENGAIRVEAVRDVFGYAGTISGIAPGGSGGGGESQQTAPTIYLSYVANSAIRVGLFPADTTFTIQLERADDEAFTTNAVTLADDLAGTTAYYDDTVTVGLTKYYRAKLTRTGWTDGPYSAVLEATAAAGTPGSPAYVAPTVTETATEVSGTATLTLTITDPQSRVFKVEFKTKEGLNAESGWATDTSPYSATVPYSGSLASTISYRVSYVDDDGDVATIERTVTFNDPDAGLTYTTSGDESASLPNSRQWVDGSGTEVNLDTAGEIAIDIPADNSVALAQATDLVMLWSGGLTQSLELVSILSGKLALQYSVDDGETWDYIDGDSGCYLSLLVAGVARGAWATPESGFTDATGDVLVRPVGVDPDGVVTALNERTHIWKLPAGVRFVRIGADILTAGTATIDPIIGSVWVEFTASATIVEEPTSPDPVDSPPDSPDPSRWYKWDVGLTLVSTKVSAWADQSGNGYDLEQATDADRPTTASVGGKTFVSFDASQFMQNTEHGNAQAVTVLALCRLSGSANPDHEGLCSFYKNSGGAGRQAFHLKRNAAGSKMSYWSDTTTWEESSVALTRDTMAIVALVWDATAETLAIYKDGVKVLDDATFTEGVTSNDSFALGAGNADQELMRGEVAELITWDSALSDGDREAWEDYLNLRLLA